MSTSHEHDANHAERVSLYALRALSIGEAVAVAAQIAACPQCREELEALRPVVGSFAAWPTDVLRPAASLWDRLAERVAAESGQKPLPEGPGRPADTEWEEVAPGISVRILSTDAESRRVSLLVRLAPGTDYPSHRHAGIEELHLLDGELKIDDRTLHPGDYTRAEPGTVDRRVWSATGCTCFLVTSPDDPLL